jgi:hypothetical protein
MSRKAVVRKRSVKCVQAKRLKGIDPKVEQRLNHHSIRNR